MKVFIDFNCNILYSSQYIDILRSDYKLSYKKSPYNAIKQKENLFLFSLNDRGKHFNFVIDFADSPTINLEAYGWSDAYGKINFNLISGNYPDTSKIVKISPSFGVKIWEKYTALYYAILNILRYYPGINIKKLLSGYLMQRNRLSLSEYTRYKSDKNYIFFASTLWNKENHCYEESETNNFRADFIRSCKSIDSINFEGGFAPNIDNAVYPDLFMPARISIQDYIEKTRRSACVFNTPAVFSCHGWKLGEYLALGKAIISTPLKNELPVPLEHGLNVHFISGDKDEIREAVRRICTDDHYRITLENGAYKYWLTYGHPKNAINELFKKANLILT